MKKFSKLFIGIILVYTAVATLNAQTPDVIRAEYMLMPTNSTEAKTSRIKLVANIPIPVRDKKDFIVLGAEYNMINFEIPDGRIPNSNSIEKLHVLDINFAYVYKLTEEWRIIGVITPRWSSNLVEKLQPDDFNINYTAGVYKDKKNIEKPYKLVLGASYNASSPVQVPLPVVYFEKRFHPQWAYVLGVPKSGMKYFTPKGHFFQTELFIDGYYVNIQNNILLPGNTIATDVSSSTILLTFGYQYKITKDMSVYLMGGHSLVQNGVLRDADRKDIFTLNDGSGLYFRTGFRIGI